MQFGSKKRLYFGQPGGPSGKKSFLSGGAIKDVLDRSKNSLNPNQKNSIVCVIVQ